MKTLVYEIPDQINREVTMKARLLTALITLQIIFIPATQACTVNPARAVMDSLLNLDISQAEQQLQTWPRNKTNRFQHDLYAALTVLVKSYNDGAGVNQHHKDRALKKLKKLISKTQRAIDNGDSATQTRLVNGMAEAYTSAILLSQDKNMRAYNHSYAGREQLQELVNEHPDMEDAYLVLGMFEYFLGSIPDDMKSRARAMGMEGDRETGLSHLERTVENAEISAPEAARVLLLETELPDAEACRYRDLSELMHNEYPANELFAVTARIIRLQCRISEAEGQAVAAPIQLTLNQGCMP